MKNFVYFLSTFWFKNVNVKIEKFVEKNQKSYPYYHRKYPRVPNVDECGYGDHICLYEANEQFMRDRLEFDY